MTPYQQDILAHARQVGSRVAEFHSRDIAEDMGLAGRIVSRTSSIGVALNYLAADGHLRRVRSGVFALPPAPFYVRWWRALFPVSGLSEQPLWPEEVQQ